MSNWLRSLLHKADGDEADPVLELLVVEGADAGQRYTVDGDEVLMGRQLPEGGRRGILLRDPTVSGKQALIRRGPRGAVILSLASATNPTLVDGREAHGQRLVPGSRIQVGRVVIDVRKRTGMTLGHLGGILSRAKDHRRGVPPPEDTQAVPAASFEETEVLTETTQAVADPEATQMRTVATPLGELVVQSGFGAVAKTRYPIWPNGLVIGRAAGSDVQLTDRGVSRKHASLVFEENSLVLEHHSQVNSTLLNEREVTGPNPLRHGDVIRVADQVSFEVRLADADGTVPLDAPPAVRPRSLKQNMEEKIALDHRIVEEFSVEGSFLDVDVVNSYGMKLETVRAERIIVSFERFRSFVGSVVEEYQGHVLNSNGDELMCYFETPLDAVRAGSQVLSRLPAFNQNENLLEIPFRFRLGIHTGRSLVDLDQGVSYSAVLDAAGHLQKRAAPNEMVISQKTLDGLPPDLPFDAAGVMEREGFPFHRLTGVID